MSLEDKICCVHLPCLRQCLANRDRVTPGYPRPPPPPPSHFTHGRGGGGTEQRGGNYNRLCRVCRLADNMYLHVIIVLLGVGSLGGMGM